MAFRRVLYGLLLAAVFLFQISNNSYLAHFLLALTIALPILSLVLSLPGMLGFRLELASSPAVLDRGEAGAWSISIEAPTGLPLARTTARLTAQNLFTGEVLRHKLRLNGMARRAPIRLTAAPEHCGLLELQADKLRVYDYLGLFAVHPAKPRPARLLCRPVPRDPGPVHIPDVSCGHTSPHGAARRGPGEDYDLRGYRPGDPMRSVHWKLSSKWDDLIVREPAETFIPLPLLTFDRFGPPPELDRVLDRLLGHSRAMLAVQRPHAVLWLDGEQPQLHPVSDEKELRECLLAILSVPAPLSGTALDGRPELLEALGPVFRIHIAAGEESAHDQS